MGQDPRKLDFFSAFFYSPYNLLNVAHDAPPAWRGTVRGHTKGLLEPTPQVLMSGFCFITDYPAISGTPPKAVANYELQITSYRSMKALLGRKVGMSQMFSPAGEVVPVTLIVAEPNQITLRRTEGKDGYTAVQLALPKPKVKSDGQKYIAAREFKTEMPEEATQVSVDQFKPGDVIEVVGISKGKGFQGVVKRHHFKGGPASHGHRLNLRRPGSIGQRFPQHTLRGMRMATRMGADRVTVKNLTVVSVDTSQNLLAIKGALPGKRGSLIEIRSVE